MRGTPDFDVRRSILLGEFIKHRGVPELRRTTRKAEDIVETFSFPASSEDDVFRAATIGASSVEREDGGLAAFELFMVLPSDMAGCNFEQISALMFDVFAHGLRPDVRFNVGYTIAPTPILPIGWPTRAILLDHPRVFLY